MAPIGVTLKETLCGASGSDLTFLLSVALAEALCGDSALSQASAWTPRPSVIFFKILVDKVIPTKPLHDTTVDATKIYGLCLPEWQIEPQFGWLRNAVPHQGADTPGGPGQWTCEGAPGVPQTPETILPS